MNRDEGKQIEELKQHVERLADKLEDLTAHLVGDMTKPGSLRIVEKIHEDMYGEDGVMQTMEVYKNDRRWILGAATGIGLGAGALGAWIKSFFSKP